MLRFISFGSGSSGNCYYILSDRGGLIIDVGVGIRDLKKNFNQYGLSFSDVRAILVTHDHADHVRSAGSLSSQYNLPVFATEEVHQGIEKNYVVRKKIENSLRRKVSVGEEFRIGDFEIYAVKVPHDSQGNVAYRIKCDGITFVLATDVGHVTDEIAGLISEANYLVLESNHEVEKLIAGKYPPYLKTRILSDTGHLSNENCGKALLNNATPNLRKVWLCHLSHDNNDPELAFKTVDRVLRDGGIIPGKDFELEVLKRTTPCGIYELK
jgi:phosphoribosyl 1,2-cyclic phosphodiesterase